jgi:hypothetical protein
MILVNYIRDYLLRFILEGAAVQIVL